jgi:hypothetical protein
MKTSVKISLVVVVMLALMSFALPKTQVVITVRNELGNIESGVTVQLYEKEDDYLAEKNIAFEGLTDAKGVVRFKEVKGIQYYVLARKDDKDNTGGGEQTKLDEGKINKVTIIIQ